MGQKAMWDLESPQMMSLSQKARALGRVPTVSVEWPLLNHTIFEVQPSHPS